MARRVTFRPAARVELIELHEYIAAEAGGQRALAYVLRLEALCLGLADFPERGRLRAELGPGVRSISFERKTVVAYTVVDGDVDILAILHAGRQYNRADQA